jgi:DNA mismatch repair protein MutH
MITRIKAISNLEMYLNQDLRKLALDFGITTFETGKQNKGWKGQVLEKLAGLENNNRKAPNGLGFELKSVSFEEKNQILRPRETMAITMINPKELIQHSFFESHCWEKLKSLVFCAILWTGHNQEEAKFIKVTSFDFLENDEIIKEIQEDYEFIRQKLISQGFASLTGKDGKWIQARTKGAGHGSISRAFYAKKELVKMIFEY